MVQAKKPTKEEVRSWLNQRKAERTPPPSPDQIRRELGWHMVPYNTQR